MGRTGIGVLWLCFCCAIPTSQSGLVNVAPGKTYHQSSNYPLTNPNYRRPSCAANGNTNGTFVDTGNCIHTTEGIHPWWQVNLGRMYPVSNITVWGRTDYVERLYPLTITVDGQQCVTATSTDSRERSLTCTSPIVGSVVRLTRNSPGPDYPLNLCEVQIWSTCQEGDYNAGTTCEPCSYTCKNSQCDTDSGRCKDCHDGYYISGTLCVLCNINCMNARCDTQSGRCTNGCKDGWYGTRCVMECYRKTFRCIRCVQDGGQCTACSGHFKPPQCTDCENGYYKDGGSCIPCNSNCVNGKCDSENGRCTNGCKRGWYGNRCGMECNRKTPRCTECVQDGGQCTACSGHFKPPQCTDCENGYYKDGDICIPCNSNCVNGKCNSENGRCTNGCKPGWYGDRCDMGCSTKTLRCTQCDQDGGQCTVCSGHFIPPQCTDCVDVFYKSSATSCTECTWKCDKDAPCNKTTGHCAECPPGKKGDRCDRDCDNNHYGLSRCSLPCGQCKGIVQCDPVTGHCQQCESGWNLPLCQNALLAEDPFPSAVVGSVVGILVVVIIVAVVVIVVFRRRRQGANKSNGAAMEAANVASNTEELNNGDTHPKPKDASKPQPKPAATPAQPDTSAGDVYENFSGTEIPGAEPAQPDDDIVIVRIPKTSAQASNGKNTSSSADGRKQQQEKPSTPASSTGNVYENVPGPIAEPKKSADSRKASGPNVSAQTSNGKASSGADGKKLIKPPTAAKPGKGKKAARASDENTAEPEDLKVEEHVYGNDPKFFSAPKSLVLSQLQEAVADKLRGDALAQEFGSWRVGESPGTASWRFRERSAATRMDPVRPCPTINGGRAANYNKNRFKRILPYDKNRVELDQVDGNDAADYINASFIKGSKLEKGYIASQGPKTNTLDDFWRMVWQEKVTDIVMLTNLKEANKDKCCEYWPAERATMKTRHMEVTGVGDVDTRAHFVIRTFDIKHKEGKDKRRVKQYHYVSWMDHEVPATTHLINFWRYVRTHAPRLPSAPPLLVHCSAGVGRTGTFIALDIAIDEAEQASEVNLFNIVDRLRDDRCYMVQNKGQYAFLHEAVLEAYTSRDTRIEVAAMGTVLPASFNRNTPNAKIDAEYEMLDNMRNCPTVPAYTTANMPENRAKNRNPKALPNDEHLVYITQHVRGRNQYINGVSMPTFLQQRGSIMTQLPLPDTMVDLWRLVDGSDVKLIVSLGEVKGQQAMCCYWPKEERKPIETGPYVIKMKSSDKIGNALWSYTLTLDKDDSTKEVRVLHYTSWTGECADDTDELIHLLTTIQDADKERGRDPVIVQCIDGSLKSGVLCALWDVVSRMTHDEELDVYLAARMVTMARPEAFVSVEQYRYCYEVALKVKDSYSLYYNMM